MGHIETEQLISDKENELKVMLEAHQVVQQAKLTIERQILVLELEKKDKAMALSKSSNSIKQREIEIRLLTKTFWNQKREIGA